MKNFLLILIFILWAWYYFIPFDTKVNLLEMAWIDSSFMVEEIKEVKVEKWVPVTLEFDDNKTITYKWDIANWKIMDLEWASLPFVKCFYAKDYVSFNWNVTLHRFYLPKNKNVEIKLNQEFIGKKLSMYVYKTEAVSKVFPPEKTSVYDCEKNMEITLEKTIQMNWNTAPSDIVIWVSGMKGITEWWYTLEVVQK